MKKITLKDPKDAEAYFNRGLAYEDKGQYYKAISDYSKSIEINRKFVEAYNNRGNALFNLFYLRIIARQGVFRNKGGDISI